MLGGIMEEDKKLLPPMKPSEVIMAELRIAIPGVLQALEKLEEAKKVSQKTMELIFDI